MTGSWPLNLPARAFLQPPGGISVAWGMFDAAWYCATYRADAAGLTTADPVAVLAFYLGTGQGLGHAPNMLFDETWHRRAYPGIAALVQAGRFPSAFDAYCRGGCLERSAHWLFDEVHYRHSHADLNDTVLAETGLVNGYDHYLWRGSIDGRIAHPLFDPAVYRAQLTSAEADAAAVDGAFRHCLRRLDRREPEPRTSIYFDPVWYLQRYPEVAEAIAAGTWRWALEHYLCNDTPTRFDPIPGFSEAYYLATAPDAAAAVDNRQFRNGYAHFLRFGRAWRHAPNEAIDLAWYGDQETVRRDLESGLAPDAFTHWLAIGQQQGLRCVPAGQPPATEQQAKTLFRARAFGQSTLFGRTPLRFAPGPGTTGLPAISVVMVLHNQFELTLMALGSLRANYPGDIELLLVDSGSTDETSNIQRYAQGATYLRFDTNIGYLLGCNAALARASADAVLYLNSDVELAPGAVAAALRRLGSDARIGAVGGMVIRTHNVLQEAGNIVWCDGSTQGYRRDASPLAPEANFVRDVDFCSAVFLMARRTLLNELHGFDEAFAPAYHEDADLCIRMAQAGYRVVYDPAVAIYHLEYGSATSGWTAVVAMERSRRILAAKHAVYLSRRPARGDAAELFARTTDTRQTRVLFMEDTVPLRITGSGFGRANDLVRVMAAMGYGVTVYPFNGCRCNLAAVYADMPDSVEVMHTGSAEQLADFMLQRRGYYHAIWLARTHNLGTIAPLLQRHGPEGYGSRVILDTEAVASLREAELAALEGRAFDVDAALAAEFRDVACCDNVVAVSRAEAATLRELGIGGVSVIGHMRALHPTPSGFAQRTGMLFVGAIHRVASPNYDSLCWFVDEVMPLIERELGCQTRLTVAGYTEAEVSLDRFRYHPRVALRGAVADLEPLYDQHRVFVAPTRFAAGTPYKVCEAASFGLPVVATALLRRQLGWEEGHELLTAEAADPAGFAAQVVALHRDEALWRHLREAALQRLRRENSQADYAAAILDVLGPATA